MAEEPRLIVGAHAGCGGEVVVARGHGKSAFFQCDACERTTFEHPVDEILPVMNLTKRAQ